MLRQDSNPPTTQAEIPMMSRTLAQSQSCGSPSHDFGEVTTHLELRRQGPGRSNGVPDDAPSEEVFNVL